MCKAPEQPSGNRERVEGKEVARKASQGPLERAVEGHRRLALVNRRVRAAMRFYDPKIATKQSPRNIESHKSAAEMCFCASKWAQQRKP